MLCRFCFSHRNFGCFDLVCLIVPSTFVIFPIGITVICNIICLWMGNLYAATPGQNPGVARIYIYICCHIGFLLALVQWVWSWSGAFPASKRSSAVLVSSLDVPGEHRSRGEATHIYQSGTNKESCRHVAMSLWHVYHHFSNTVIFLAFPGSHFLAVSHWCFLLSSFRISLYPPCIVS